MGSCRLWDEIPWQGRRKKASTVLVRASTRAETSMILEKTGDILKY
jgi:hypothetical protein